MQCAHVDITFCMSLFDFRYKPLDFFIVAAEHDFIIVAADHDCIVVACYCSCSDIESPPDNVHTVQ